MFMSFVFLVLVKSASAVVRARASAALWGSALVNRTCSTGGQANFLLPELVAGTRIVFPALVGKTGTLWNVISFLGENKVEAKYSWALLEIQKRVFQQLFPCLLYMG